MAIGTDTCRAELYPLPSNVLRDFVVWAGEPVHPDLIPHLAPVQGPQPARCIRDHPGSPWHWDGQGTWWRN